MRGRVDCLIFDVCLGSYIAYIIYAGGGPCNLLQRLTSIVPGLGQLWLFLSTTEQTDQLLCFMTA